MRHGDAAAVVGDRDIAIAPRLRRMRHVAQACSAVGGSGVGVQVATNVLDGHKTWQFAASRSVDLALVFAQLGWRQGQAEALIQLRLGAAGETPCALEQAIFIEFQAMIDGDLAQRDVVRLRPGEVAERGAVALLRHHAQIHLKAVAQPDGRARCPLLDDFRHVLVANEPLHDRPARFGCDHNVEIADGFAPSPVASRDLGLQHTGGLPEMTQQRDNDLFGDCQSGARRRPRRRRRWRAAPSPRCQGRCPARSAACRPSPRPRACRLCRFQVSRAAGARASGQGPAAPARP